MDFANMLKTIKWMNVVVGIMDPFETKIGLNTFYFKANTDT